MKDKFWEGKPLDASGAVLTPEILEEAARRSIDDYGRHMCEYGHLVNPSTLESGKGNCVNCGVYLDLTRK